MVDDKKAEELLDLAVKNSVKIQELVNELVSLASPKDKSRAKLAASRLEKRMFYQDYLYDCHGALAGYSSEELDSIITYDEYVCAVTTATMLHDC